MGHSNAYHSYTPSEYPLNPGTQSHMAAKSPEETQTEALPRSNQTVAEDFELNVEASFLTIDPTCSCFILNFTLIEYYIQSFRASNYEQVIITSN